MSGCSRQNAWHEPELCADCQVIEALRRERDEAERIGRINKDCYDSMAAHYLGEHGNWGQCRFHLALQAAQAKLQRARETIQAGLNFRPFRWRFNHTGAMNATQLAERDRFLEIEKGWRDALADLDEGGDGDAKTTE